MYSQTQNQVDVIRGWRTCGMDDIYLSDPEIEVQPGMVITPEGQLATLTGEHIEVGMALQANKFGRGGYDEFTGKIPVMLTNFKVRTNVMDPIVYVVGDPVTVVDGLITKGGEAESLYGYVTAVGIEAGTIDVRVTRL